MTDATTTVRRAGEWRSLYAYTIHTGLRPRFVSGCDGERLVHAAYFPDGFLWWRARVSGPDS